MLDPYPIPGPVKGAVNSREHILSSSEIRRTYDIEIDIRPEVKL